MLAEVKPAPKREGSPQSSIETVETVATEKEMVAEKQMDTAQACVGLAEPGASMQRAAPSETMQVPSESPDDSVFVAPLASKEDEKAETQVAVEEEVKTLDAGAAKTAAVQPKQQTGCFDAILAILPCGRGQ